MIHVHDLPAINATLNATSAVLLSLGWHFVQRGQIEAHRKCMLAAVGTSIVFLASYLSYHALSHALTPFPAARYPTAKWFYFPILISHTVLAATVPPLVAYTLWLAHKQRWPRHKKVARWTLPIWFYVSVTGVIVYAMLYHWFPN